MMAESAWYHAAYADHLAASELLMVKLASGLGPFNTWLADIAANPTWDAPRIGQAWGERYKATTNSTRTASCIDLAAYRDPGGLADQIALTAVLARRSHSPEQLRPVLEKMYTDVSDGMGYADLGDWFAEFAAATTMDPALRQAASAGRAAYLSSLSYAWNGSHYCTGMSIHKSWAYQPPVSTPIPVPAYSGSMPSWNAVMPLDELYAWTYGDAPQHVNAALPWITVESAGPTQVRLRFSEPMIRLSPGVAAITWQGTTGSITDRRWVGYEVLEIDLAGVTTSGSLSISSAIWDQHGSPLDQNRDGIAGQPADLLTVPIFIAGNQPPTITGITAEPARVVLP